MKSSNNTDNYRANMLDFWNSSKTVQEFGSMKKDEIWEQHLNDFISENPSATALDIGCGAGKNLMLLIGLGFNTSGFDISKKMIIYCEEQIKSKFNQKQVSLKVGRMDSIPFDGPFGAVISNGALHNAINLKEYEKSLNEILRVTIKNGLLLLNVFTNDTVDLVSLTKIKPNIYATRENTLMVLLGSEDIRQLLISKGFEIIEIMQYERELEYGKRSVLRLIARKRDA